MDILSLLCIVSVTLTGLTKGVDVLSDGPLNAAVGGTVIFNTTLTPPEKPFLVVAWSVIINNTERPIITDTSSNNTDPEYEGRITLYRSTGSLELRDLTLNDNGRYIVSIIPDGGNQITGSTELKIFVPVSNIYVNVSSTDLVEFNSSVSLFCFSSGSPLSFVWLNGSSEVKPRERVKLSSGYSNLTIFSVTRYDQGPYRCKVSYAVSEGTSDPVNLSISFGPENINLMLSPTQEYYVEGSDISLSCSAASRPPAQFQWFLNGVKLSDTGPELTLINIRESHSGDYSCQAFNNKTLRYQTSQPSAITVLVPVSNVKVEVSSTDLVEFNSSVSLFCSSSGSSLSFVWLNGSSEVKPSERVQLTDGNSNLTIFSVTRYDQGLYSCKVSNAVSEGTSDPVNLSISFGPENIDLMLSPTQDYYVEGSSISLSCSAASKPPAHFQWFLNGVKLSDTGPELTLINIQESQSGDYSCQAFNNKTLRYQTSQPSAITVLVPVSNVKVEVSSTDLVELNSSVILFCSSSGSSLSFLWLNGSSEVKPSERVPLNNEHSTFTIPSVTRYDQGPYSCNVSNAVSEGTSDPVNLSISFGPENIHLMLSPTQEYYVEGSDIRLSCSAASRPPAHFQWFLNGVKLSDTGPELTLINIRESHSGNYSCQAFNNKTLRYQTSQPSAITVLVPVSNVKVEVSSTDLVEFSNSVILFCSSSGSSLSFVWLNGSSEIKPSERVPLTNGHSTLTIFNVTRYDQGPYRCKVSNAVSEGTSDPVNLSISFGPENIHLMLSPTQEYYVEGSNIRLSCSAASRPPAHFQWFLNGVKLSDTGSELTLINIRESQSGDYSCQAFNNKTLRYQTSQPSAINVVVPVSNVKVEVSSTDLVEFSNSVILFCSSSGSSLSFVWLNGSSEVKPSERVPLTNGHSTLTIFNVTRYDQGPYRCKVSNSFSEDTSDPVNLSISFGPENIHLMLSPTQEYYLEGSDISLSCSAASRPPAQFQWFLNGVKLSDTGPELTLINIRESQSGDYSCQAFNNKTLRYQTSQPSAINVVVPVSNVKVEVSSTDLVEFNSSVSLFCSSSGSSLSFVWLNDNSEVTANERVQLTDGNSTLTISSVTRYDQGPYRCKVSNAFNEDTSDPVNLSISFGPENIHLMLSPTQEYYVEGSNISLSCSAASKPPAHFQWFLNGVKLSDTGPELTLINIRGSQSGDYSCQAFNNKTLRYQTSQPSAINVVVPVSNVKVEVNNTDLVEFNSSVSLSCSSSGSSLSFVWLNGSSEVKPSERVPLNNGHSTLTIPSVTRYDQGSYSCKVSNSISEGTSDPVNLSISFGPENIHLMLSPTQEYYFEGSSISLSCSAASTPPAHFQWFLNGVKLSDTGPELTLINIEGSQSGDYSCQAFNNKTLRYQTSQPSAINVMERISSVNITSIDEMIEGNSVNLTCDCAGTEFTREWMKDGSSLTPADNMTLHDENRVLSFLSLEKTHSGEYLCKISNAISFDEAEYSMVVNYGPEDVQITGQSWISIGETLNLTCSAASTPSASYTWSLNGIEILNDSAVFTKNMTELSDSGNYTCQALNNKTGRTSSAEHQLSVTEETPACGADCIAGSVVACCAAIGGAVGGGFYFFKKQMGEIFNGITSFGTGDEGLDNTAFSGDEVLWDADISLPQDQVDGIVLQELQNNETEYAQIQRNSDPAPTSSLPTYDEHIQRMQRAISQYSADSAQIFAQVQRNQNTI
ncbi:hemicentin-1-like isoform X1 [Thunnus thynnus]|uniref:hemicentin-1-like isoform X1 n=1 Tax=Thunnus thynnus TaxID=8237 RepID=UPI0035298452